MGHPFRHIIAIIILVSGLYAFGQSWIEPTLPSTIQASAVVAVTPSLPSLKQGASAQINLGARAFLSAYVAPDGSTEIMIEKGGHAQVPIASVTKLMTALVSLETLNPEATTTISRTDLFGPSDDPAQYRGGEIFTVRSLLNSLLVESSNYSAHALARVGGGPGFIQKMNDRAHTLGMGETYYANVSGLDQSTGSNFSSAYDLLILAKHLLAKQPEILTITGQTMSWIQEADGRNHHLAETTNKLLTNTAWPATILGGKTGSTPLAKTNLVLILKDKASGGYLVNIVLGSDDHFGEMTKLIDWVYASYEF